MASIVVQNIQVGNNDTVLFYEGSTIIQSVSQLAPNATPYILRDGLNIVIINRNPGNDYQLSNGSKANDHLIFSTQYVTNVGARVYTPVNQAASNSGDLNLQRAREIYSELVLSIFKGCCDCSENGGCDIQYQYSSDIGTGQFYIVSGKLLMSMDSYNGTDFSGLFHHIPNGSWLTFFNESNPNIFFVYEINNYTVISGLATWDYTLIDSQGIFVSDAIFCVDIKPALSAGGGGSQSWQQTLDVDSTLDKDNTVDAGSFDFIWNNVADYAINSNSSISESVDLTATVNQIITDTMQLDTVTRQIIDYDTGDEGAHGSEILAGIIDSFIRVRNEGESLEISFTVKKDGTYVRSALINAGTAVVGHPYVLLSATTGRADFGQIDTVGLKDGSVTYVKMQNVSATDRLLGRQTAGAGPVEEIVCTAAGRALIDDASASAQRTTLGIKQCIALSGGNLGGTIAAGATVYFAPTVDATPGATETARCSVIAFSGTVVSFYYQSFATQPATGSLVLTFRRAIGMGAFASTSVVITIAAGSAAGIFSDTVNTATVAAGDRVSIQGVNNASTASGSVGSWQIIEEQSY